MPIKDEYSREEINSSKMRKKLGLPEKFTLLIVGGGNGISSAFQPLKSVLAKNLDISIVCINGRNQKSYKQSVISETLAVGKPFIAREKLILNERFNKRYLIENGCALGLDKISDAGDKVQRILENPGLYQNMKENISRYARPNAARDIAAFMAQKAKEKTE